MKPFFSEQTKNLLQGLLEQNPNMRLGSKGIQEIKDHPFFESIDWKALSELRVGVPYKPQNAEDCAFFDPVTFP